MENRANNGKCSKFRDILGQYFQFPLEYQKLSSYIFYSAGLAKILFQQLYPNKSYSRKHEGRGDGKG